MTADLVCLANFLEFKCEIKKTTLFFAERSFTKKNRACPKELNFPNENSLLIIYYETSLLEVFYTKDFLINSH